MTGETNNNELPGKLKWEKVRPVFISIYALTLLICFLIAFRSGLEMIIERGAPETVPDDYRDRLLIQYLVHILFAGIYPLSALAYTVFERPGQQEDLTRDLSFLGISPETDSSVTGTEARNGNYTQIMHRFKSDTSQWNYAFQYVLPLLATILGLGLFFDPPTEIISKTATVAMRYGFLGAYIYSIQYIYRRYTTLDLPPNVYMHCGVVLVAGMAFNYVAFNFIDSSESMSYVEGGLQAVVAFSLGYFPALAINWFSRLAFGAVGVRQRRADFLSLGLIDGISQFHESRLRDEGIDNIQNLASAKIDRLLLNTPFGLSLIIEWIDQAILFTYLDPSEIESFRRGGVRSITNFRSQWEDFHRSHDDASRLSTQTTANKKQWHEEWKTNRESRAQQLQSTPQRLDALFETTDSGANVADVRYYWQAKRAWTEQIMHQQLHLRREEMAARYRVRRSELGLEERPDLGLPAGSETFEDSSASATSESSSSDRSRKTKRTRRKS